MTITSSMYVIAVPNLERSAAFYTRVLGFEAREMGDAGWRMFVKDQCRIMAGQCPDALPAQDLGDHSYFAYLVVDNVEVYYERARVAGASWSVEKSPEWRGSRRTQTRTNLSKDGGQNNWMIQRRDAVTE